DRALARDQLPARVLDRVPRRPLEEPIPALRDRAVLRHLPDPHARVGDDPLRRRDRRLDAPAGPRALLGRVPARDLDRRRGRHYVTLHALLGDVCLLYHMSPTRSCTTIHSDGGIVASTLRQVHVLGSGGRLLATSTAVVAGITYNFLPFMVLPLYVSLEQVDGRLIEAAQDLYASRAR